MAGPVVARAVDPRRFPHTTAAAMGRHGNVITVHDCRGWIIGAYEQDHIRNCSRM